jgi:hypothetical protein
MNIYALLEGNAIAISCANVRLAALLACIPEWHLIHKAFFGNRRPAHNMFKEVQPCKIDAPLDLIGGCGTANLTQCVVSLARNTRPSNAADWPRFAITSCKNRHDGTKSDCVTIFQRSISDKIAIDLCPVRRI